jgi:hypothetical protein
MGAFVCIKSSLRYPLEQRTSLTDWMTIRQSWILQGTPWSLTLYVDFVYMTKVDRPGDSISTAYTRMNPMGNEGLYRRNDAQAYLSGIPM